MNEAINLVTQFLQALEEREIDSASALLAPEVEMIFPGGATFTRLDDLVAWAKPRYRWVRKAVTRMDTAETPDGTAVFCQGTLYGEWPDGTSFDNIRFADWFLLRDGLIARQHVWNDIAEIR